MALRFKAVVLGAAAAVAIAGASATLAWAQAGGEQVVKERSDLMRSINEKNKIIAAATKGGAIDDKVVKAAEEMAAALKKAPSLFPAGTGDDKLRTRAKPAIWQDWPKFEANAKDAAASFTAVAAAAKAGDKAGVEAGFTKGNQACSACHKETRGPALK